MGRIYSLFNHPISAMSLPTVEVAWTLATDAYVANPNDRSIGQPATDLLKSREGFIEYVPSLSDHIDPFSSLFLFKTPVSSTDSRLGTPRMCTSSSVRPYPSISIELGGSLIAAFEYSMEDFGGSP